MSTVKDIIDKLQKYPPDMQCIIEPNIHYRDNENAGEQAYKAYHDKPEPILFRIAVAQKGNFEDEGYSFDDFQPAEDDKQVLVISSTSFKYGKGE